MPAWVGTIVGGMMGFGASVIPEVVSLVRAKHFHRASMEAAEKGHANILAQLNAQAQVLNGISQQITSSAQSWIDLLSASVRPVLTYMFFGMFFFIKAAALYHALHVEDVEVFTALPVIWDSETSSLFAAIISFWFGSRALGATVGTATLPVTPSRVPELVNPEEK